jgi:hypothetical protein
VIRRGLFEPIIHGLPIAAIVAVAERASEIMKAL